MRLFSVAYPALAGRRQALELDPFSTDAAGLGIANVDCKGIIERSSSLEMPSNMREPSRGELKGFPYLTCVCRRDFAWHSPDTDFLFQTTSGAVNTGIFVNSVLSIEVFLFYVSLKV